MKRVLSERLAALADTQEKAMRDRLHAAMRVGAELALARCIEMGGYNYESNVRNELKALVSESDAPEQPELRDAPLVVDIPDTVADPVGPQF